MGTIKSRSLPVIGYDRVSGLFKVTQIPERLRNHNLKKQGARLRLPC